MGWPPYILCDFELLPDDPGETDFHGPYNNNLNYLFPIDSPFAVFPQYLKRGSSLTPNHIVAFEVLVLLTNRPVFILELKQPSDINYKSTRQSADEQIRHRLGGLGDSCPIPTLHAVSAIGTRLCFYSMDTRDVEPEIVPLAIPRHPTRVNDTAPQERWNCDVLGEAGEARLRAIVDEIQQACADITKPVL